MKKNIQEEVSRIKTVMGMIKESDFEKREGNISPMEVIERLKMLSQQVDELAEQFASEFVDTEYWRYVENVHSGLRSVSDMEMGYTRSDERSENINFVIDNIKSDFEVSDSSVENDDYDEKQERNYGVDDDMPGFEGTMDSLNDLSIR
jgi:hypothetical protein